MLRGIYFGLHGVRPNNKVARTFARYLRKMLKSVARGEFSNSLALMQLIIGIAIILETQTRGKHSKVATKAELSVFYFEIAAGIYPTSHADFLERMEEIATCELIAIMMIF